jgi:uncharacterized protein (TIGR03067 family)
MKEKERRGIRPIGLALGFALLASAATGLRLHADEPKVEGDLKTMQGEWVSKDDQGESTWSFKGNKLSLKTPGRAYEIELTLDPKADPKAIDLKVLDDSPNAKGYLAKGIYKLADADKALTICFGDQDTRPKEFKGDFQSTFLFEMKKK